MALLTRPEVLHCYGVDFLSNKEATVEQFDHKGFVRSKSNHVLEVFEKWQPNSVEWLDDSSCNLIFEDEAHVQKAIRDLALPGEAPRGPWTKTQPLSVGSKDRRLPGEPAKGQRFMVSAWRLNPFNSPLDLSEVTPNRAEAVRCWAIGRDFNGAEALDLKSSLKRAEVGAHEAMAKAKAAADRGRAQRGPGRQREGTPGRAATPGRGQPRGKKRRPVEQEPRPVSEAAPPQRKAQLFPEVEAFLTKHGVRYKRYLLQRSFRSIKYAQQEAAKTKAMAQKQRNGPEKIQQEPGAKQVKGAKSDAESAWDQYMKANKSFTSHGVFMQTVAWKVEGRRVLSVVPHPQMTDIEKVAKAVQKPVASVVQCKLKDISQETGFPVFVCPPFGYPPDADGRPPLLLVDSSIADLKKPLLFDCGSTGLAISVSEFLRSTRAACVENLAKQGRAPVPNDGGTASPEPAPEPAPIKGDLEMEESAQ
eukprot:Skav211594  [mRNA]  locus=scaffold2962:63018:71549:- [translate_table: standard]